MGEIIPFLILALAVLFIIGAILMKMTFNRKVVVKPMEQEDLVERVKIPLTSKEAKVLSARLDLASDVACGSKVLVATYLDGRTDRMVEFEVTGSKSDKTPKTA